MKQKVMNIRPQEVTIDGERSVRYKGSDGKFHDFSAKLPQDAAIPVKQKTVIAAGTEITLAQAHAIEDFDFNKVSALQFFGNNFSIYADFEVNKTDDDYFILIYQYHGRPWFKYIKNGDNYTPFLDSDPEYDSEEYDDNEVGKNKLAERLLDIAQKTGELMLYKESMNGGTKVYNPNYYDEVIKLTLAEDIAISEDFFISKSSGELVKIGLPNNAAVPVAHRTIIEHGTEITLEQAHAIEGFDFNKCSSLRLNENFGIYTTIYVNNTNSTDVASSRYLEYIYPGSSRIRYHKDGHYYPFFSESTAVTTDNYANDEEGAKNALQQHLLEIAQETGKLEIYKTQTINGSNTLVRTYEDVVLLTITEDIMLSEEFFFEGFSGDLLKIATVNEDNDEPHPYSLQNNPNAYEIIDSGETIYNGNKKYIAKACDGTETTIDSNTLYEILLNDPNTTIILKDEKPGLTGTSSTTILRITEIYESSKDISLTGKITGNTTHSDYYVTVHGKSNENWITLSKITS